MCHRILLKGSNINLNHYTCFKCSKKKEKGNFLSVIGISNSKIKEVNYIVFIDEIYMYFMKDIIFDNSKPHLRRLGNKYNLYQFGGISFSKIEDTNTYKLLLEIAHPTKKDEMIQKDVYFTENVAQDFFIYLQKKLTELGIMQITEGETNENQDNDKNENGEEYNEDIEQNEQKNEKVEQREPDIVVPDSENNESKEYKENDKKEDNTTDIKEDKKEELENNDNTQKEEEKDNKNDKEDEKDNENKKDENPPEVKHKKKKKAKKKKVKTEKPEHNPEEENDE